MLSVKKLICTEILDEQVSKLMLQFSLSQQHISLPSTVLPQNCSVSFLRKHDWIIVPFLVLPIAHLSAKNVSVCVTVSIIENNEILN